MFIAKPQGPELIPSKCRKFRQERCPAYNPITSESEIRGSRMSRFGQRSYLNKKKWVVIKEDTRY